jgi:hypothetical protein
MTAVILKLCGDSGLEQKRKQQEGKERMPGIVGKAGCIEDV